jgi:hypothetical protein
VLKTKTSSPTTRRESQQHLTPRTVSFDPKLRTFGNCLVGALLVRVLFHVFRFTLQGF